MVVAVLVLPVRLALQRAVHRPGSLCMPAYCILHGALVVRLLLACCHRCWGAGVDAGWHGDLGAPRGVWGGGLRWWLARPVDPTVACFQSLSLAMRSLCAQCSHYTHGAPRAASPAGRQTVGPATTQAFPGALNAYFEQGLRSEHVPPPSSSRPGRAGGPPACLHRAPTKQQTTENPDEKPTAEAVPPPVSEP